MPNNWKTYKLGDISIDISYGYTESASLEEIGPKFLRITDIQNDFISWENVPYCKISDKNLIKYKLEIGDIVVARTGNSTGETIIIKNDINAVYASYLIRYRLNLEKSIPIYVSFILRSIYWKNYVNAIKGGSAQPGANAKQFADFELNLPPLQEQQQIASILSALDDKRENNLAMNKTLEDMAMALYKHWFVDFGPFQEGEFVDSELGMIPKGWEVKPLFLLANFKNGKGLKSHLKVENGKYDVFGSNGRIGKTNEIMFNKPVIAIGRVGANYGEVHYSTNSCWISDNAVTVQPKKQEYFWWNLQNLRLIDYSNFAAGSAQPLITQGAIKEVKTAVPHEDLLIDYSKIVSQYFNKLQNNIIENQTLTQLRDTLLPKLISGEVRLQEFTATLANAL